MHRKHKRRIKRAQHQRTLARRRRNLKSIGYETLEKRLLLAVTPAITSNAVTFNGDADSDQLYLSVNNDTKALQYRSDSAAPWNDLATITPSMTATQIIVDLADGDDTLSIDAALVKALSSQTDNDFRYLGGGNTDTIFVSVDDDDSFVLTTTKLAVR
ncbi:hypothetical protein N9D23_14675, partial [Rubripirellula sp.]|nr:hypothetical protein [Rubripirellula sp.]